MDNFTHSLAGWALGQAGLKTQTRKGLAALILAANMPDIDVFFGSVPWEPLAMHRGFTHSLVGGVVVMPPILFGLLLLLDRWQLSRGATFKSGLAMRPGWLLALCYIGALSHPLLDLLTTYSVQLLSPFSGAWFHADGLFIIDVWVWVLLAASIEWSRWKEKAGERWQRPVQAAIAILLAYIAINLLITQRAYAAVRNWAGDRQVDALFASPPPVQFWRREPRLARRRLLSPERVRSARWRARRGDSLRPDRARRSRGSRGHPPPSRACSLSCAGRCFRRPRSSVRAARFEVLIGDARYGERGRSRLGRDYLVPTGAPGC